METSRKSQLRSFGHDSYSETHSSHHTGFDYKMQAVTEAASKFGPLSKEDIQEVLTGWFDCEEDFIRSCEAFDLNEAERQDYGPDEDEQDEADYWEERDTREQYERLL